MARALLILLLALSYLAGPVSGVQAKETVAAPCAMHVMASGHGDHHSSPAPVLHECKMCLGCAPVPADIAAPNPSAYPAGEASAVYAQPSTGHEGRSLAPEPEPPRRNL